MICKLIILGQEGLVGRVKMEGPLTVGGSQTIYRRPGKMNGPILGGTKIQVKRDFEWLD